MKLHKLIIVILFVYVFIGQLCFLGAEEEFRYDPKHKRDPFAPLVGPEGDYITPFAEVRSISDIRLEGIVWDPKGESLAIINGKIVKEGDMFEGAKIDKIYSNKIVVLMHEQEFTINLLVEEENKNEESQISPDKNFGSF